MIPPVPLLPFPPFFFLSFQKLIVSDTIFFAYRARRSWTMDNKYCKDGRRMLEEVIGLATMVCAEDGFMWFT